VQPSERRSTGGPVAWNTTAPCETSWSAEGTKCQMQRCDPKHGELPIRFSPSRVVSPSGAFSGSLPSVLRPLLTSAPARRPLLDAASDPVSATGPGGQISMSKDANSACATMPFTSGAEHRVSLCCASVPALSAWNGISARRLTGLTVASFPRDLAIPQLPLSSASIILLPVTESQMTVFPHRELSPHQFVLMSGAHKTVERMAAGGSVLTFGRCCNRRHRLLLRLA